ncbi:cytochrome P450 9e2-like [Atheta coriaria]|uniref:cytochrome P450 9e2-like n=1 Tax=Dalotia coriaria TaxID=877792 RepID=UPI0031F34B52
MLWVLGIAAAVLFFYYFLYKPQLYWKEKNVSQGPPVPILGDNWKNVLGQEAMMEMLKRIYNRHKNDRYAGFYQTTMPSLMIRDPELIKQITIKDFDHFVDHRLFAPENVEPIWTKNLFSLKGDTWRDMRATLSPTFTASKMRSMFVLMEKSGQQYVDFYLKQNKNVIELELKDSFTRFANDVIANCAFGVKVDSLKEPENEFYMKGKAATNFSGFVKQMKFLLSMMSPKLSACLGLSIFESNVTQFFQSLIHDTVKMREEQNIIRPDMINLLMEARKGRLHYEESTEKQDAGFATVEESDIGKVGVNQKLAMTESDMAAQVLIFFFAGFETISTMMSFMCYELALHPEIQEKLHQEIDLTYKNNNGKLTYDVLNKMKYMDMVISESMRKNPAAVMTDRICTKAYTIQPELPHETPLKVNVGDLIIIPVVGIHNDEKLYPNPDKFDPERFSDENKDLIKPYTYLPFGVGPRNCIGSRFALMECKTLIFHILSNFELTVIEKTTVPMKISKKSLNPAIEGGCWVGFKRRENLVR